MNYRTTQVLRLSLWCVVALIAWMFVAFPAQGQIPLDAGKYKRELTRNARMVWGLDAPISTFAGQIHQESGWRADATSPVGAAGLAQFMPATAGWISGTYKALQDNQPNNPTWAIRALVEYNKWLYDRVPAAASHCERMAFVLSSYNGGMGNLQKDVLACKRSPRAALSFNSSAPQTGYVRITKGAVGLSRFSGRTDFLAGSFRMPFPEEVVFGSVPGVLRVVLPMGHDLQVAGEKIRSVFVDVMYEDLARQLRTFQMFRYKSVNVPDFALDTSTRIPVVQEDTLVLPKPQLAKDAFPLAVELIYVHDGMVPVDTAGVKCDPTRWFDNVEKFNGGRSMNAFAENRTYPNRILNTLERRYRNDGWGITSC